MIRTFSLFFLISTLLALSISVSAKEIFEYNQSIKALGMGGVRYPDEDDATIMMWNPAGLGYLTGINWRVIDLGLGINGLQIYNDLRDAGEITGANSLSQFYGKNIWLGLGGNSTIAVPYFGFSASDNGFANLQMNNPAFPSLDVVYYNDYAFVLGLATVIGPKAYLGMNFKRITRMGGDVSFGPDQIQSISNSSISEALQSEGTGYGLDIGALWTAPVLANPTISLSWQDIGSTAFSVSKGTVGPPRIKDNLSLGMSLNGSLPGLGFATGFEYRHITDQGEQFGKKVHVGIELSFLMFDFRGGFYQGYPTYGLGIDLWLLRFDVATYAVEKGVYPGQTKDERVQLGISMNLGFDPNFNLTDSSGKRRKLKQRR